MTKTASELNQESFNSGWWYIDLPIQTGDMCLEYLASKDPESLMRTLMNRARILPCELEETSLIRKHPLLEQHDIEMVFRLKCKFGGRVLAQRLIRGDKDLYFDIDPDSLANYFNDDEETNGNAHGG